MFLLPSISAGYGRENFKGKYFPTKFYVVNHSCIIILIFTFLLLLAKNLQHRREPETQNNWSGKS